MDLVDLVDFIGLVHLVEVPGFINFGGENFGGRKLWWSVTLVVENLGG